MTRRPDKELLQATRDFVPEDLGKTWGAVLSTFAVIFALAAAIALAPWWPLKLALAVVQGLTLVRGFCLFHDVQHGALLRDSTPGHALFWVYGQLLLTPVSVWKETHNYHHAHTAKIVGSHIGSYPMLTPAMYLALPAWKQWMYRAARHPVNLALSVFTVFGIGMCVRPFLRAPAKHWSGLVALLMVGGIAAACAAVGHFDAFVWCWFVPMVVATASGAYLFYAQHNFPEAKVASRESWNFVDAALDSSSYMKLGPVMNWFTANIGLHHVHHLNAAIPFYRLPEAMAAIPELQHPGVTSLKLSDVVACFHLKLWDPEKNTMVPYPETGSSSAAPLES
jgi:omega-6 fatty acid desaturase (delta-12 desaturase)